MKKFFALILVLLLCSCASPTAQDGGYTFLDDLGREVTVSSVERVAALTGSFAEVWLLAGGEICAAADDAWEELELTLPADAVNLGATKHLSLEALFSAKPDLVLASCNKKLDLDWQDTLESAGIQVAYFDVADFGDYLRMLKICTDLTGRADLYEKNGLAVQEQIDAVVEKSKVRLVEQEAPTVLLLRTSASGVKAKNSESGVPGQILKALGCINIADSDALLLENLSMEHILKEDPDYIFFVQMGNGDEATQENIRQLLTEHPAWEKLTAVQQGKVFFLEKKLYQLKPNALWGEAYEKLEAILNEE